MKVYIKANFLAKVMEEGGLEAVTVLRFGLGYAVCVHRQTYGH